MPQPHSRGLRHQRKQCYPQTLVLFIPILDYFKTNKDNNNNDNINVMIMMMIVTHFLLEARGTKRVQIKRNIRTNMDGKVR